MSEFREGYSEIMLDHLEHPRNSGVLENANAVGYMTNPVCGDTLLLMLRIEEDRIAEARWQSDGCAASLAASSLLSELVAGKSLRWAGFPRANCTPRCWRQPPLITRWRSTSRSA